MNISIIKKLAEEQPLDLLKEAEHCLTEGLELPFAVEGSDEGEQLTHLLAAIWIKEEMLKGTDLRSAIRLYSQKVRNSIS